MDAYIHLHAYTHVHTHTHTHTHTPSYLLSDPLICLCSYSFIQTYQYHTMWRKLWKSLLSSSSHHSPVWEDTSSPPVLLYYQRTLQKQNIPYPYYLCPTHLINSSLRQGRVTSKYCWYLLKYCKSLTQSPMTSKYCWYCTLLTQSAITSKYCWYYTSLTQSPITSKYYYTSRHFYFI